MNKIILFTAVLLLFCGCSDPKIGSDNTTTTEVTIVQTSETAISENITQKEETEMTTIPETQIESVEYTTEITETAKSEAVSETASPETEGAVTDPAAEADPVPVDYSKLSEVYGYIPDIIPNRTWNKVKAPSPADQAIDPSRPMIALTFDDGPGPHTERLLNIFAENGGKGTFFVTGSRIDGRADTIKRIFNEGHEIGNHTFNHANLPDLDEQGIVDQIMMTRAKIYAVTGYDCHIMRPPYGTVNDTLRWTAAKLGVAMITWSVDTVDWHTLDADKVYDAVMAGATDGKVVLCHDIHPSTVDAMERVIPELIRAGYQLVTVSELKMYSGSEFKAGYVYS